MEATLQKALADYHSRRIFIHITQKCVSRLHIEEASDLRLPLYDIPFENLIAAATIFEGIEISRNSASI
jgi:hypothetical protein